MDLRSPKVLCPEDKNLVNVFVFGGVLGDHPPRDRTKQLRDLQFETRQLGETQMTTDTALLVTKLIIQNGLKYDEIPFVDEPEVCKDDESV